MNPHIERFPDVDFSAERFDDDCIAFTISGKGIYTRAFLEMPKVIELRKFLNDEIEQWLNS